MSKDYSKFFNQIENQKEVKQISYAGSLRRQKETIGDIDILVVSKSPKKTADFFKNISNVFDSTRVSGINDLESLIFKLTCLSAFFDLPFIKFKIENI